MTDRTVEKSIETITEMKAMIEAGTGHFQEAITTIGIRVQATVAPGQDQEQVQTETE